MRKSLTSRPPEPSWRHWSEQLAACHLQAQGMELLAGNWRSRRGELDLVMKDGDTVVFVEVRQRSGSGHGSAAESIVAAKLARLRHTAGMYLLSQYGTADVDSRFDVVLVSGSSASFHLQHLRGVA